MNLSICIITKNEEQNIDRCLKALAPYGLETIVVDTGSTDRTKQIAAHPGAVGRIRRRNVFHKIGRAHV